MQYRKFGKLDWKPSALGFGLMRLPTLEGKHGNIDYEKATEMVLKAIEGGVNYIDTAYVYHEQMSEVFLGKVLQGGLRQRVRIATKSPVWLVKESGDFDRLLDEQLQRLQTEMIDFYLLHALNDKAWNEVLQKDMLRRAEAARADGRIRHIGFSFHDNLDAFKKIVDGYDGWDFCQIQYNYMDTTVQAGTKGLRYAAAKGLAVVIMEPLLGGKLALDLPATRPLWASAEVQRTPAEWALQWLWDQPEVSLVLSGMSTLQQVEENLVSAARSAPGSLQAAEAALVCEVCEVMNSLSPIPCTRCEYCLPCPNGVNIPRNFEVYNNVAMYGNLDGSRNEYKRWIPDEEKAAACIQCEECLDKCPQQIAIPTWLMKVEEVLGLDREYVKSV